MMADNFATHGDGLSTPPANAAAVTPNDGADLATASRALWVGGAGDVAVTMVGGQSVTIIGALAGSLLPVRVTRVKSTGTTATSIVAMW